MAREKENRKEGEETHGEGSSESRRPERDLSLRDAFNRFLDDDFFIEPFDIWRSPQRVISRMNRGLFPRIDISESDQEVKVVADIPGVDPDQIDIQIEGNRMVISGQIEREQENKNGERPYRYERSYGRFRREFVLPSEVREQEAKAVCKDGVLTVVLPKEEEAKKKKIKIEKK